MSESKIDTSGPAVERRCLTLDNVMSDEALEELRALLRALAAERDAARRAAAAQADTLGVQMRAVEADRDAARAENEQIKVNIAACLDGAGTVAVRVHEGGGPEYLCMSLAVTMSKIVADRDAARAEVARLREALQAMWDSACRNANSTPSKAAFLKARAALAGEPQP